jgi:hypothetical protein
MTATDTSQPPAQATRPSPAATRGEHGAAEGAHSALGQAQHALGEAYLGPAVVAAVDGERWLATINGALTTLTPAMPLRYQAQPGDVLLVAAPANRSAAYAIGVIHGQGACHVEAEGDLELRSRAGTVRIQGQAIETDARRTVLRSEQLELHARSVLTRATNWLCQLKDKFDLRAKRRSVRLDGLDETHAERVRTTATGPVAIDGSQVHLG